MKKLVLVLALLAVVALPIALSGCGSKKVPAGAIAAVASGVVTQEQFNQILAQAQAQYKSQPNSPPFPKEGTPQYNQLKASIVTYLVQNELIAQKAKDLGVTVSDKELQDRVKQIVQSVGGQKKLDAMLKKQNVTMQQLQDQVKAQMLMDKVKQKVYAGIKVSDAKVKAYFDNPANKAQFQQPESRDIRHVLVKTKAEAEKVRALLEANNTDANWKKVAAKYSTDPGSKDSGGALGAVQKGRTVPAFEKAAWALPVGQISQPVKTQFGWHVLETTKINAATTQTFDQAKSRISQMLLFQEQATAWQKWLDQAKKDAGIVYAPGYNPDMLTAPATPAQTTAPSPAPSASK